MTVTASEFVNSQIRVWGFDYIEELLDKGYEPAFITDGNGNGKWTWIMPPVSVSPATETKVLAVR